MLASKFLEFSLWCIDSKMQQKIGTYFSTRSDNNNISEPIVSRIITNI